ncbi:MAG: alpha/beta hydrolase, partial [Rhodospirillales bacterium]|nr:alpha/beta hydrolase [Rhodospirillales bacterium]
MKRRAVMASPLLAAPLVMNAQAQTAPQTTPQVTMEEHMIPSGDAGIDLFLRNKRPEGLAARPDRTLLMVHGATYP